MVGQHYSQIEEERKLVEQTKAECFAYAQSFAESYCEQKSQSLKDRIAEQDREISQISELVRQKESIIIERATEISERESEIRLLEREIETSE